MNQTTEAIAPIAPTTNTQQLADYQIQLKEKDQLIGQLQLENLALKGSLREGTQHLQSLIDLLQIARIPIPGAIALYLGQPISRKRQMESVYQK